jgi:hypothetical protein
LTLHLTDPKEQISSWESNISSISQEIPRILWNPKVYYRIRKGPPTVSIQRQINPIHNFPFHFLKIHFITTFPSKPKSSKWLFPSGLSIKTPYASLLPPIRATCPTLFHSSWLDQQNNTWWEYRSWSYSLCGFLQPSLPPDIMSGLGPNTFLSSIFSKTLNRCSSYWTYKNTINVSTTTCR